MLFKKIVSVNKIKKIYFVYYTCFLGNDKMYGFEVYDEEFLKPLLFSFNMLKTANITFSGSEVSSLKKYWRFFYMIPIQIFHYISVSAYILKVFNKGIDPFENANMLPLWLSIFECKLEFSECKS